MAFRWFQNLPPSRQVLGSELWTSVSNQTKAVALHVRASTSVENCVVMSTSLLTSFEEVLILNTVWRFSLSLSLKEWRLQDWWFSKSDGSLCRNIEVEYGLWTETNVLDSIVFQGKFWLTSSNATPISINSTDCWRSLRGSWWQRDVKHTTGYGGLCLFSVWITSRWLRIFPPEWRWSGIHDQTSFLVLSNTTYVWSKVHEEARSITALIVNAHELMYKHDEQ